MGLKLVSTSIFSGQVQDCKCEIYQEVDNDSIKFTALLYVSRKVSMEIEESPVSMRRSDAPNHKYVDAWVRVRVLQDITESTLESVEASVEHRYLQEPLFIPTFIV